MRGRSPVVALVGLVGLYVVTMVLLGLLVTHPPLLGWVGLGVLTAALAAVAALGVWLFPRVKVNATRLHPHAGPAHRLLVVLDADVEPEELGTAIELRGVGRNLDVRLVAPTIASSTLHYLTGAEETEQHEASRRLQAAANSLEAAGIPTHGQIGTDDPLQAAADALATWPADEILLVAPVASRRTWLEHDLEREARDLLGLPVATVFGRPAPLTHA